MLPFGINLVIFIAFEMTILAAAIFERMDDRFLIPHAICCLLFVLVVSLYELKNESAKKSMLLILGLVFCLITLNNRTSIGQIVTCKQTEIQHAYDLRQYIREHYQKKVLIFDLPTMGLFLDDPMVNAGPDTSNTRLIYGDLGSSIFTPYRAKIKSLTKGSDDADCFLRYATENDARFLITDDRKKLYEKYVQQVYHKKYVFSAIDTTCPIYKYHFCALPYKYNYGVYKCTGPDNTQ